MRRLLVLGILLASAGCQSLKECHDEGDIPSCPKRPHSFFKHFCSECEVKKPCEKKEPVASRPPVAAPKTEVAAPVQAPAIAQDILLVPKMVYIPYAPQTPVAAVRVASPPPLAAPPDEQPKVAAPAPKTQAAPPCDVTTQMLDVCKKLNHRLDCLEQKIHDRNICPPALQQCPTPSFFPNFRRPLFYRGDPLENCEPCPVAPPANQTNAPPSSMEQIAPPMIVIPTVDPK